MDIAHRNGFAVVRTKFLLHAYLEGTEFMVQKNHRAIRLILNLVEATNKLSTWQLRLMESNFVIVRLADVKHKSADALLRLPTEGRNYFYITDDIAVLVVSTRTQRRHNKVTEIIPEQNEIEEKKVQLPTLDEFMSAQCKNSYCEKFNPQQKYLCRHLRSTKIDSCRYYRLYTAL